MPVRDMALHCNLYVYGLTPGLDEGTFQKHFELCGKVLSIRLVAEKRYGFVSYSKPEEAYLAIATLNGTACGGSVITVQQARHEKGTGKGGAGGLGGPAGLGMPASGELFVRGLPVDSTSESIKFILGKYGALKSCTVMPDGQGGGMALVNMIDTGVAAWMVTNLNGNIPQGLEGPVKISFAQDAAAGGQSAAAALIGGPAAGAAASARFSPYGGCAAASAATAGFSPFGGGAAAAATAAATAAALGAHPLLAQSPLFAAQTAATHPLLAQYLMGGQAPREKGFKTKLCTYFTEGGTCPNGENCTFAHGANEVPGWKSRMCKFPAGTCPQGDKCSFAHAVAEVMGANVQLKMKMCKYVLEGALCPKVDICGFAHDPSEIGQPAPAAAADSSGRSAGSWASSAPVALAAPLGLGGGSTGSGAAVSALLAVLAQSGGVDLAQLAAAGVDLSALASSLMPQHAAAVAAAASIPAAEYSRGPPGTVTASLPKGFKTRMCTYFLETGACTNGSNCTFAHGAHEIMGYKSRMCKFAANPETCPQSDLCSFAHSAGELRMGQR